MKDEERARVLKLTGERKIEENKWGELYSSTAMIVISFMMNREAKKRKRKIYFYFFFSN
jgi:hypothetical protein